MVKKPHIGRFLRKLGVRTIFKQWLQFLAIIMIDAVAVTLFVGLCSNADNIQKRTNTLYEGSNIADVWTNVTSYTEEDEKAINTITEQFGYTEKRFAVSAEIGNNECTALMSEELPTINKAYDTDNIQEQDFFIIDRRLFSDPKHPYAWDLWIDENGYYRARDIDFNFAAVYQVLKENTFETILQKRYPDYYEQIQSIIDRLPGTSIEESWNKYKSKTLLDVFDSCLIDDTSVDIFDSSTVTLNFQITGSMMFAENVQSSTMNNSNFLLDMDLYKAKLKEAAYANYKTPDPASIGDDDYLWITAIRETNILEGAIDTIIDSYNTNTYCTKLYDKSYTAPIKDSIQYYFNSKAEGDNNLIMCTDVDSLISNVTIQNDIKQARQLAYIFPIVFFLVAILVVLTTFSQLILKERTQIGTLKAIGVSKRRIVLHYLAITTVVILIGSIIGCIVGPILLSSIMNVKYAILYTLPPMGYVLAYKEAIISTLATVLISAVVTLLVVRKEVVLNPAESMRPASPKGMKTTAMFSSKKTTVLAIKMAFRNIRVNLVKSLMVVVGVMGCTSLLVCGFGIDDTLDNGVSHDMTCYYNADITLSYGTISTHKDEIYAIEGVSLVEEYALLPSTIKGEDALFDSKVFCIEERSQFFLGDDGYEFKGDIVITQKEADALNLHVGDTIEFSVPLVRKEYFKGTIGAIFDTFYIHGIFLNAGYNDYGEIMKYRNNGFVAVYDYSRVDEIGAQIKNIDGILNYKTRDENNDQINSYMSSISLMTLAVKCFAIVLAVVVLYNLALLNFKERNRDIATMKVLGFNQMEIMLSLIIEVMVLTAIGIAFGLLLGKPLEILVLMVNKTPLVEFMYAVYLKTYFLSFGITFGTGLIVNLFLSFKARGVKMVESLKSVD